MKEENRNKQIHSVDELPEVLTIPWVARFLGCGLSTAYKMIETTDLPHTVFGHRVYIDRDKFLNWVNEQTRR